MRRIILEATAQEDLFYWAQTDLKTLKRVRVLLKDTVRNPFGGMGKPEPLKHNLKGFWSKRITDEHRLVYTVTEEAIVVAQCRKHYQ
jgi:toxin YoeB